MKLQKNPDPDNNYSVNLILGQSDSLLIVFSHASSSRDAYMGLSVGLAI